MTIPLVNDMHGVQCSNVNDQSTRTGDSSGLCGSYLSLDVTQAGTVELDRRHSAKAPDHTSTARSEI